MEGFYFSNYEMDNALQQQTVVPLTYLFLFFGSESNAEWNSKI